MKHKIELRVCLDEQRLEVIESGTVIRSYRVSTSLRGMGEQEGSLRTPRGKFRISEKIGDGQPIYTIFKARQPVGRWDKDSSEGDDLILTRILRLEGLEPHNINTHQRCIYIHGTNQEQWLGQAVSHGCVRLSNLDMLDLFECVEGGEILRIEPYQTRKHRLLFLDFDVLLTEGFAMDHLVSELRERMNHLGGNSPSLEDLIKAGQRCGSSISSDAKAWVTRHRQLGWKVVIYSACPLRMIESGLGCLEVDGIESGSDFFDQNGSLFTCKNKWVLDGWAALSEVMDEWAAALPCKVIKVIGIQQCRGQKTLILKDYSRMGRDLSECISENLIVGNLLNLLGGKWI